MILWKFFFFGSEIANKINKIECKMIVANLFPKKNYFFPKNFIVVVNHSNFANLFPKKKNLFPKRLYSNKFQLY